MDKLLKMDKYKYFVLSLILVIFLLNGIKCETKERVCSGTSYGLGHETSEDQRLENYKRMYTNCTLVSGNLEILFLSKKNNYDLSFLSSIKEVTGYVLLVNVFADYIPLTSLIIIRGKHLFKNEEGKYYSLYVSLNYKPGNEEVGLRELRFVSLSEIMNGDVYFFNNQMLCLESTIDWSDIFAKSSQQLYVHNSNQHARRNCGECHASCVFEGFEDEGRHCWGEGPNMCQKPTKKPCAKQCNHRCYDTHSSQCCHQECVGGCNGPTNEDCWACKNFKNDSWCVPFCPKQKIYDTENYGYKDNPYARYTYGTLCVEECPSHLVVSDGGCVRSCGASEMADKNMHCQPCPNGICPKTCPGTEAFGLSEFIHAKNIQNFTDCTIIDGNIRILPSSFDGDDHDNIPPMHPSKLSVLRTIREISGYLMIQGEHPDFTSLSFFESLEVISGREQDNRGVALNIVLTSLESFGFRRKIKVQNGNILIARNSHLCYTALINWRAVMDSRQQRYMAGSNKNKNTCQEENQVCHPQCSSDGCWGSGPDHCLECQNFTLEGECVETCDSSQGIYQDSPTECKRCDPECFGTCTGQGANQCDRCRNYQDGPFCVKECPENKYPDESGICTMCNVHCVGGCTGPLNTLGPGGCKSCNKVLLDSSGNVIQCLSEKDECKKGKLKRFYRQQYRVKNDTDNTVEACAPCHPLCQECWTESTHSCDVCTHFREQNECVQNCSTSYYPYGVDCLECDSRCEQCYGPSNSECLVCKQYKVYMRGSDDLKKFNCSNKCPDWAPLKDTEESESGHVETLCIAEADSAHSKGSVNHKKLAPVIGSVVGIIVMLGIIIIVVTVICQRRAKALESKERLAARMSGLCEESEITPLTPTDAKPDMAKMRIIKESELRKGTMVGSGAFGTVYKGFWIPDGENVKIPVAIKVLQEGTSASQNQELLEEARVMAAVDNKFCVPILGVCMTAQMMLITPYMPLGCLLDYVRKNKENIGSKVLLDWCAQIATGMAYLEDRGIVHRDLAARNVLVQNPKRVRVTDFGLSKLLDVNEEEFKAAGGKMPIKWLALECIQHRVFTHKSDVWSFGVTIWELCTYGMRPYENIRARDIPELLEKGERLPQPAICTIDVYMIMIKCWMLDALSRPSFKELGEEFSKMARDPGRYLFIQGDKFMRLPSHSTESRRDMFRNMSVSTDGPEEIVEAEEYLQPSEDDMSGSPTYPVYRPRHHKSNGKLEKVKEENSGGSTYDNERGGSGGRSQPASLNTIIQPPPSPKHPQPHHHQELKYGGLEAAAAMRKQREAEEPGRDSVKSRYSSDPCKVLSPTQNAAVGFKGSSSVMNEEYLPPAPPTPIAQGNSNQQPQNVFFGEGEDAKYKQLQQQLPLDEDDYLQPQSAQHLPKYLDVVQDDYLPPSPSMSNASLSKSGEQAPVATPQSNFYGPMIAENPEYFDSTESDKVNLSFDPKNKSQRQPLTASYRPQRSTSTESEEPPEHDYYNETDLLQKKKTTANDPSGRGGRNYNSSRGAYSKPRTESVV